MSGLMCRFQPTGYLVLFASRLVTLLPERIDPQHIMKLAVHHSALTISRLSQTRFSAQLSSFLISEVLPSLQDYFRVTKGAVRIPSRSTISTSVRIREGDITSLVVSSMGIPDPKSRP